MDYVGPMPKSKAVNKCLLTIVCTNISFPEDVPLRNIKEKTVKAIARFFTAFELPKVLQKYRGNINNLKFRETLQKLWITHITIYKKVNAL